MATFCLTFMLSFMLYLVPDVNTADQRKEPSQSTNQTRRLTVDILKADQEDYLYPQWPLSIVSYYMDTSIYDNLIETRINIAMDILSAASCVKFKKLLSKPAEQKTWLHITNLEGTRECMHEPIYKDNGEIIIILGFECLKGQEILHALLHGVGFKDEVTNPQRDQYIRVLWENIRPEYRHLYRIQSEDAYKAMEYDPFSVMHFHDRAFSSNGHATVAPLVLGLQINPSDNLSALDKLKLQQYFSHECNKRHVDNIMDTCKNVLHGRDVNQREPGLHNVNGIVENISEEYSNEEEEEEIESKQKQKSDIIKQDKSIQVEEGDEDVLEEDNHMGIKELSGTSDDNIPEFRY